MSLVTCCNFNSHDNSHDNNNSYINNFGVNNNNNNNNNNNTDDYNINNCDSNSANNNNNTSNSNISNGYTSNNTNAIDDKSSDINNNNNNNNNNSATTTMPLPAECFKSFTGFTAYKRTDPRGEHFADDVSEDSYTPSEKKTSISPIDGDTGGQQYPGSRQQQQQPEESDSSGALYSSQTLDKFLEKIEHRLENPVSAGDIDGGHLFSCNQPHTSAQGSSAVDEGHTRAKQTGELVDIMLTPLLNSFEIRNSTDSESEDEGCTPVREYYNPGFCFDDTNKVLH